MYKLNIDMYDACKDRPSTTGYYIGVFVNDKTGDITYVTLLSYSSHWDRFNCQDHYDFDQVNSTSIEPAYWCEVPKNIAEVEYDD